MNTSSIDLSAVAVVDNHAHPLVRQQPQDGEAFRRHWSEAHSSLLARREVPHAVYYRWTLHQLGQFLGVAPTEEAILRRRGETSFAEYARRLIEAANLAYLLLDTGYPPPGQAYTVERMEEMLGIRIAPILRLETLVQDLIMRHRRQPGRSDHRQAGRGDRREAEAGDCREPDPDDCREPDPGDWREPDPGDGRFDDVVAAFDQAVSSARAAGYVALKSIAVYRTGLAIEPVTGEQAEAAFEPVRREAAQSGTLRLASKPLIDYFVLRALREAANQELPVQFHTGYGDPDLDLRLANPLQLRPIFEEPSFAGAPIVLLHESYPYTAEAAYLAAVYPNAYLDIAFTLPPLDRRELKRVVGLALGAAPAGKVMCSSDGVGIPEQYWLGAVRAREIVGEVLSEMAEEGELSGDEAEQIGRMVLCDNARRAYRLQ